MENSDDKAVALNTFYVTLVIFFGFIIATYALVL